MSSEQDMKKLDRRIKRTRRLLSEALVSLSLESGYDEISIRSLTQRADVGYATFYRHFKSKDELLTYCIQQLLREIQTVVKPEQSHYEVSLLVFELLLRYKRTCQLAVSLSDDHPAWLQIWAEIRLWLIEFYSARDETNIPQEIALNHLVKSCKELVRWWLHHGQEYSPEQMATMQSELILDVINSVALGPREKDEIPSPIARAVNGLGLADSSWQD